MSVRAAVYHVGRCCLCGNTGPLAGGELRAGVELMAGQGAEGNILTVFLSTLQNSRSTSSSSVNYAHHSSYSYHMLDSDCRNIMNTAFSLIGVQNGCAPELMICYCRIVFFRGHVIFAVERYCCIADFNFRGSIQSLYNN